MFPLHHSYCFRRYGRFGRSALRAGGIGVRRSCGRRGGVVVTATAAMAVAVSSLQSVGVPVAAAAGSRGAPPGLSSAPKASRTVGAGAGSAGRGKDRPHSLGEVTSDRSARSRVFRFSDGSLHLEEYSTPIFYQSGGTYAPIDDTLKAVSGKSGYYATSGNAWTVLAGPSTAGVSLDSPSGKVTFTPSDAGGTAPSPVGATVKSQPSSNAASAGPGQSAIPQPSVLAYPDVWPDATLQATISGGGVSDDVVVSSPDAPVSYTFSVSGAGLRMATTCDSPGPGTARGSACDPTGGVAFTGDFGRSFSIAPPRVLASDGTDITAGSGVLRIT